ncbi:ComF family protein [Sphingobium nicotianae]|uniref:ComF family protein n=1 Tax=Sphingobium nicotianae TaxID=2782607 RepID=A0A9X1AJF7_9SPHN|nr:ComF family protein [Sphingobium nicotianae]MBT2185593.1 ComF family protein [Sphingobium nicotianae]
MGMLPLFQTAVRPLLDYALPPRCAACGVIVDETGTLCAPCWSSIDFLGEPLCAICGVDLPSMSAEATSCGACIAAPPPYDRARAVMRYGEVARLMAHRLKYGRRLSLSGVMAAHIARLLSVDQTAPALIVPVPLHRWRIWSRGFNQAALIARHVGKRSGLPVEVDLLRRVRNTPPLHALGTRERARVVRGAFALAPGATEALTGRTVILIDDIWTTGATATACSRLLRQGGAGRIEILCWTRVTQSDD